MKGVKTKLMWVTCLLPGVMAVSRPRMLPRAMFVVLPQPESVLTSMAHVAT